MCFVKTTYPGFLAYCGDTLSFPLLVWPGAHFFSEGAGVEHVVLMFVLPGSHIQGTSQNSDVPCSRMPSSPFSHRFVDSLGSWLSIPPRSVQPEQPVGFNCRLRPVAAPQRRKENLLFLETPRKNKGTAWVNVVQLALFFLQASLQGELWPLVELTMQLVSFCSLWLIPGIVYDLQTLTLKHHQASSLSCKSAPFLDFCLVVSCSH